MKNKKKDIQEVTVSDTAEEFENLDDVKDGLTDTLGNEESAEKLIRRTLGVDDTEMNEVDELHEKKYSDEAKDFISKKISKLTDEGKPHDQAVAIAINMARDEKLKVPPKPKNEVKEDSEYGFDNDTSYKELRFASDVEGLVDKLRDVVDESGVLRYHEEMAEIIKEKLYWAVMDGYDAYRRSKGGRIEETDDEITSIGIANDMNPEIPPMELTYDEEQEMLNQLGDKYSNMQPPSQDINYGEEPNDLPFESVNPKMKKSDLIESILGKKNRKVVKTVKVKDVKK